MSFATGVLGLFLLAGGLLFSTLGIFGVYRMPDVYTRMHAGSKAIAMGAPMTLLGVAVLSSLDLALKALAVTLFLFLTAPVATYAVARAAHRRREPITEQTVIDELERDRRERGAEEPEPYHVD